MVGSLVEELEQRDRCALAGYDTALRGEGISECPWAPADPAGQAWRQGWITGESDRRHQAGTFDHTPEEYAAYRHSIGWTDDQLDQLPRRTGQTLSLPNASIYFPGRLPDFPEDGPWIDVESWDAAAVNAELGADLRQALPARTFTVVFDDTKILEFVRHTLDERKQYQDPAGRRPRGPRDMPRRGRD